MSTIHEQIQSLRDKAATAERERIRISTQQEEAIKAQEAAQERLTELGVTSPAEARAKADAMEAEIKAAIEKMLTVLA